MAHFDALVFDLDGTLTDSEALWDEVRRGLAADDGVPWPDEATHAMMGMSTQQWSRYLSETVGLKSTVDESARRTIEGMQRAYEENLPLTQGAQAAVRRMAAALPIGLCTSSPRVLIEAALTAMDVTELFQVTVSTEEVGHGKPNPAGYLKTCELLGVDPTRAVAVEDSRAGIEAALNAGMSVIAVPPHFHPPAPEVLARTQAVLASLDELTPELLESL